MEKRDARRGRRGGISCKFPHREPECPVILFPADESSQLFLEVVVPPFRLAVCLRMVGSGKLTLDAEGCGDILPERENELRAAA